MNEIWQNLLGLDRSPGSVMGEGARLEFAALPRGVGAMAMVLAVPALVALLWWLTTKEVRVLSRGRRLALVALRLGVLLALGAMLIEPVLITSRRETVRSRLAMVFDDSESMKFADPYTDNSKAASLATSLKIAAEGGRSPVDRLRETPRLGLVQSALGLNLEALGNGRDLYTYDLESASRAAPDLSARSRKIESIKPNRSVSPIGDALQGVLASHRGQPVAGLILATDGRSNAGEDPLRAAEAAVRQGIPIYAIAAGADEGPRNIRLAEIEASPTVFVRDPMNVAVVVEARGLKDAEATVVLEQRINDSKDWEPIGNQRVVLGEDGILKRSTFRVTPKVVGQHEFRARVEDAGPELTLEDNTATAAVKVVRQQIRVLMIAGEASPEVQFLRNALMRDQHVEFAAWLQESDPGYRQAGDRPISRLPNDQAELNKYDALLLVDPNMQALGPQWPEMIAKFVGQEGGGLIFVAGELHSQQIFEAAENKSSGDDWVKILPVVREPGLFRTEAEARLSSLNTYTLELTPEGRGDPVFAFHPDPIRNRAVLGSLPGMYWSFPVTRARPGATVLARHGDPRMQNQYGRHVLLASQLYGPGRTVFIGFDSTYRWRYLAEDHFDGFWARLVDRVGRNKALGGRLPFQVNLGKGTYRVGDQVTIGVRYAEAAAMAEAADLAAELEIAGQPPEPLRFERVLEDPGLLTATFPAQQAGAYSLRIVAATAANAGSDVKASTTTFRVEPPRREIDEPALNRPLLAELARLTGGRVFELADLGKLDDAIPMREVTRTLENRDELWDAPLLYAIIVLGLTGEWILRKLSKMV